MADSGVTDWRDPEIGQIRALYAAMQPPPGTPSPGWAEQRAAIDGFGEMGGLPEGCMTISVDIEGMPAEGLVALDTDDSRNVLYLHGGGYCIGSPRSHRPLAARLAAEAGCPVLVPDYRMGPESPFPAAVEDGVKAWRHLLDAGIDPARMVIAGDSAGGGLTLATALAVREAGLPQPAGLFCISPWANLTQTGPAYERLAALDPMISAARLDDFAAAYLAGADARDPLASPALADFTGLAPILIHVGGAEVLLSDSIAVAEAAGLAGVDVRLEIWPEMIHVWHAWSGQLTAGRRAIAAAGAWIRERTGG
ncbi:MAG: alpha/beta hydrolase [Caulobacter sp.]|nr:alpha/beta hydrolase [Caulobacter sp.]